MKKKEKQFDRVATFKPVRKPGERLKKVRHVIVRKTLKGDYCNLGCCNPNATEPSPHPLTEPTQ